MKNIIDQKQKDNPDINEIEKLLESKQAVMQVLESKNQKYIGDVKKNPTKECKFLYSMFSPIANCIK